MTTSRGPKEPPDPNLPIPYGTVSDAPAAEYRRCAFKHALKYCLNSEDAEEVANDAIVAFLEKGKTPNPRLSPYVVMKRPVIEAVRRKYGRTFTKRSEFNKKVYFSKAIHEEPRDGGLTLEERLPDVVPDTSVRDELIEQVQQKNLPPATRAILLLNLVYGFLDSELAKLFGWSPTWILALKRQAFAGDAGAKPALGAPSRAADEIFRLQRRVQELEILLADKNESIQLHLAKERIRHLEIIIEAKGIDLGQL